MTAFFATCKRVWQTIRSEKLLPVSARRARVLTT